MSYGRFYILDDDGRTPIEVTEHKNRAWEKEHGNDPLASFEIGPLRVRLLFRSMTVSYMPFNFKVSYAPTTEEQTPSNSWSAQFPTRSEAEVFFEKLRELSEWIAEHVTGTYTVKITREGFDWFDFNNPDDAFHYKMRWL